MLNNKCYLAKMFFLLILLIFSLEYSVNATTLDNVFVSWENVIGVDETISGNRLFWRIGTTSGPQSGLVFTSTTLPIEINLETPFSIGVLEHINSSLTGQAGSGAADLSLRFYLNDIYSDEAVLSLIIKETAGGADAPDKIIFPLSYPLFEIEIDGILYSLEIVGFGDTPDELIHELITQEDNTNSTNLYARFFISSSEQNLGGDMPMLIDNFYSPNNEADQSRFVGEPIDVITGNCFRREKDVNAGPTPMALSFERYYNSRSIRNGSMGYGWSHTYNKKLVSAAGKIFVYREDGQVLLFSHDTLEAESITKLQLTQNSDGTYNVKTPAMITELYSSEGKLISMSDLNGNTITLSYSDDELDTVTDPFGRTLQFEYYDTGKLKRITDPADNQYEFDYDDNDNLSRTTHPNGLIKEYLYEDANDIHNITKILENGIDFVVFEYDGLDRAISSTYAGNAYHVELTHDYRENKTRVLDGDGNYTYYEFDTINGKGVIKSIEGPACRVCESNGTEYTYYEDTLDVCTRTIESVEYDEKVTQYSDYDIWGNPWTITEVPEYSSYSRTILKEFDTSINKPIFIITESTTSGETTLTDYTYDAFGHGNLETVHKVGISDGVTKTHVTSFSYNDLGQVIFTDGPRSEDDSYIWNYDIDTGNLLRETAPLSGTITYTNHDAFGRPTEITDANNVSTTIEYNYKGKLSNIDIGGTETIYDYYYNGMLKSLTDPSGVSEYYQYDLAHRLTEIKDEYDNRMTYSLNTEGKWIGKSIIGNNEALLYNMTRDYYGSRDYVETNIWNSYDYEYFEDGKLNYIFEGNQEDYSRSKEFHYDYYGRLKEIITFHVDLVEHEYSNSTIAKYTYDSADNIISFTDAENRITSFSYDDFGCLLSRTSPDTGTTQWTYDPAGNMLTRTDANMATTSYSYDVENRLTNIDFPATANDTVFSYDQGVNGKGRLTGASNGIASYSYGYDSYGNLITENKVIEGLSYNQYYSYDMAGRLLSITYPDGMTVSYQRNDNGEVTSLFIIRNGATCNILNNIEYMPFGPVKSMVLGNGFETTITIDQSYLPSQIITTGYVQNLSLDRTPEAYVSEIIDTLAPSKSQIFDYDVLAGHIKYAEGVYGPVHYDYDLTGNRLYREDSSGVKDYTYTAGTSMLKQISGAQNKRYYIDSAGRTFLSGRLIFMYDGGDRLTQLMLGNNQLIAYYAYDAWNQRVKKYASGMTTYYHYDPDGNLIAETDRSGNLINAYIRLNGVPVAMVKADGSIYYYHNDHLGTPQKMTDENGAIVWVADYLPFGEAIITIDDIENNLRFPGQYYDSETGLHYNYHRYYDPGIGRYVTPDPIGLDGGVNLYAYVDSNPVNFIDPYGLSKPRVYEIGGYRFVRYPGDAMHGGPHWHVYKGRSNKLFGRMTLGGKTLTGSIPKNAKKIAKKAGLIGIVLTALGIYDSATSTKSEAFEDIMEMSANWPENLQKELVNNMLESNPDFFKVEYPEGKHGE